MSRQGRPSAGTTARKRGLLLLSLLFLSILCCNASCGYVLPLSNVAPDMIGLPVFNQAPMVYYRVMAADSASNTVAAANTQVAGTLQMTVVTSAMLMVTTASVVSTQSMATPDSRFIREALAVSRTRTDHSSLASTTTTSLSCSSTRVDSSSTPTIDNMPDAPTVSLPLPSSEQILVDIPVPATSQHGFSNDLQERSGGLPEVPDTFDMSGSRSDMSELEQAQQPGYTYMMVRDLTSAASASDSPGDMQAYERSRFTIDPTVIDPRVGMSVPAADVGSALQVCMAPQPLASSHIASTVNNATPSQTNTHEPSGFDIQGLPDELKLEVMAHVYVYPGRVIRVRLGQHRSGEPVLGVERTARTGRRFHGLCDPLPPLHQLLAMSSVSSAWRHFASNYFFSRNVFDLSSKGSVEWVKGLPLHHRERLSNVILGFDYGTSIKNELYLKKLIRAVGQSCRLRKVTIIAKLSEGGVQLTYDEVQYFMSTMKGLDFLSRLRGVDRLVVDFPLQLDATEVRRLEQCLAKPKGRQGKSNDRISENTLNRRTSAELDSELDAYSVEKADFKTKVPKAAELKRLRELDWKNPDEP